MPEISSDAGDQPSSGISLSVAGAVGELDLGNSPPVNNLEPIAPSLSPSPSHSSLTHSTIRSVSGPCNEEDGSDGDDEKVGKGKTWRRNDAYHFWLTTAAATGKDEVWCNPPVNSSESVHDFSSGGCFKLEGTSWIKIELLGSGAFGTVYKALTNHGIFFAVKEVSLLGGKERFLQLQKEIEIYSRFEHENIVRYIGTDKEYEKLYVFLELMPNGSLETLYEEKSLTDSEVSTITRQILSALKFLHDQNVLHRDIKCANILVGERGSVKLADFGWAKDTNKDAAKSSVGTPLYMAPEVVRSENEFSYGSAADIWSLGCTVLEMLTRKPPYPDTIGWRVLWKIGKGEFPVVPNYISEDAQNFIRKCLRANPSDRPTAAELLDDPFVN